MENLNLGKLKKFVANKTTNMVLEGKNEYNDFNKFFKLLNESEYLIEENIVYQNLSKKGLFENEFIANQFIHSNIFALYENFTKEFILNEHKKINTFDIGDFMLSENEEKLFNAINILIEEGNYSHSPEKYKALEIVLYNLISETEVKDYDKDKETIDETVIERAVEILNDTYKLSENERKLFELLTNNNGESKIKMFENIKSRIIESLESSSSHDDPKVKKTINKINETKYSEDTFAENFIKLYDLEQNLF